VASMLTTVMDISEAETGTMALVREPVDAAALLREAHELYEDTAQDKGVRLAVDAPETIEIQGDRRRLLQALANLTDNAVKYTPAGGQVTLRARRAGDRVVLECDERRSRHRRRRQLQHLGSSLSRDRSRRERGLGLGLSLVRAIRARPRRRRHRGVGARPRLPLPHPPARRPHYKDVIHGKGRGNARPRLMD